jgi:hypothetical protein
MEKYENCPHAASKETKLRSPCTHPEVPAATVKPLALLESRPDIIE